MALNQVNFIKGASGLGRPLDGEDHVSGLVTYSSALPSGFETTDRIKKVFSLSEAEDLGITEDSHVGETKASGTVTVTSAGSEGDIINVLVDDVLIGAGTSPASPTTTTAAAALVVAINLLTDTHGYTAANVGAVVTVTSESGSGVSPHSRVISIIASGTAAASVAQFAGGVASVIDILHYHVKEYFRKQPKGELYIGIYAIPGGAYDFAELTLVRDYAEGAIRQMGVYVTSTAFATTQVQSLQTIATAAEVAFKPFNILYAPNIEAVTTITDLPNLKTLASKNVSVCIGQDGGNEGLALFTITDKSITCLGALLGTVSVSKVSDNIGWVEKYNQASAELDTAAFSNGTLFRALSDSAVDSLNTKGYIFLRKFVGIGGTYFNDSFTATVATSDYSTIENNRTMDKAIRNIRVAYLPKLNSPLAVDPTTGYLSEDTISNFENIGNVPLETMAKNSELSGYSVVVNPTQDVLSTSKLVVSILNVPMGVARNIEFNIGYTTSI